MDETAYDEDESADTLDIDQALGIEGQEGDNSGMHEVGEDKA